MSTIHAHEKLSLYKQLFHQLESSSLSGEDRSNNNDWIFPDNMDNPNRNGTPDRICTAGQVRT
jgi:hypothetical protein